MWNDGYVDVSTRMCQIDRFWIVLASPELIDRDLLSFLEGADVNEVDRSILAMVFQHCFC